MKKRLQQTLLAALFLSLGLVLPLFTSQIKEIGDTLLPMHIPVMLCGIICGPWYGLCVGLVMPLLRNLIFSMPPIPNALWMSLELATYGLIFGLMYYNAKKKTLLRLYLSLIAAVISGRIVWGIAKTLILGFDGKSFTFLMFLTQGFLDSALGIVLQFILIPIIVSVIKKSKAVI